MKNSLSQKIFVGCSGWHYDHWRGCLYPQHLGRASWLTYYSRTFDTVELNTTFYRLPTQESVTRWHDETGTGFVFAVKGSRYVTHVRRLVDVGAQVQEFEGRLSCLANKLGPVLWQLPPQLRRDDALLDAFLRTLTPAARHVIEFRHSSWWNDRTYAVLREHRAAICLIDMPAFRSPPVATTDFIYVRFHGAGQLHSSCYQPEQLSRWAADICELREGTRTVYAYFNNDANGYAVENAITLRALLAARSVSAQSREVMQPSQQAHPQKPGE